MVICLDVSHPESVALLLMADQAEKEVCARVKLLAAERLAGQARQAAIAKVVEDCQVQAALCHGTSCMVRCLKHSIHSFVHSFVHSYVQYMSFPRDMNTFLTISLHYSHLASNLLYLRYASYIC